MQNTHKTSVSIHNNHRTRLSHIKNRSKVINAALALYYERAHKIQQAEKERIDQSVQQWMEDIKNWDIITYSGTPGDKEQLTLFLEQLANS